MAQGRKTYPEEYKARLIEMCRAGRSAESLSRDFEPTAQTIRNWMKQADLDEGRRSDGLTSAERAELRSLRRENRRLQDELEIMGRAATLVRPEKGRRESQAAFDFVTANQEQYAVTQLCRVLGVSTSGYYEARKRPVSRRSQVDESLTKSIESFHHRSRGNYGVPRIWEDLLEVGICVGSGWLA